MTRRRAAVLPFSIPGGAGGRLRRCREAWSWQPSCRSICPRHVWKPIALHVVFIGQSVQLGGTELPEVELADAWRQMTSNAAL